MKSETAKISEQTIHYIRDSFSRQGLMETIGARIENVSLGVVVLSLELGPSICQQHGAAHAGATFALADSASGYAALTRIEPGREVMTVEMKVNLLAPATGKRLIATGQVVKAGRRLVVTRCDVEAEAEDGTRKTVAILQGTMIPVDAPEGSMIPVDAPQGR